MSEQREMNANPTIREFQHLYSAWKDFWSETESDLHEVREEGEGRMQGKGRGKDIQGRSREETCRQPGKEEKILL